MRSSHVILALAFAAATGYAHAIEALEIGVKIESGLTRQSTLSDDGGRSQDYVISLKQNDIVVISAKSASFDTILTLFSQDGEMISHNDDRDGDGGGSDSLVVASISRSGDYIVRIRSYSNSAGPYTLKATTIDDN